MKKNFKIVLLEIIALIIGSIYIFSTSTFAEDWTIQDDKSAWMGSLLDSTPVSDISIPGTHDTMAFQGNWEIPDIYKQYVTNYEQYNYLVEAVAKTQDLSLDEQLNQGVRYLDIRVSSDMSIHHDYIDLKTSFNDDVLKTIKEFLEKKPTETIIARIKSENVSTEDQEVFNKNIIDTINQYKDIFASNNSTKLKDVRGKIIILDDTITESFIKNGVSTNIWGKDGSVIQDDYDKPNKEDKLLEIQNLINSASENENQFFFNHISATQGLDAVTIDFDNRTAYMSEENKKFTPRGYADTLNPQVIDFIASDTIYNHKLGILIWDFITNKEIDAVIISNEHLKDKSSLNVHDSTIKENDTWQASDNFSNGNDGQGVPINFSDIDVFGTVNTTIPGDYKIIYSYTDLLGNTISKTVIVTVQEKKQTEYHKVTFLAGKGGVITGTTTIKVPDGTRASDTPTPVVAESDIEDIFFLDWYENGKVVNPKEITITNDTTFIAKFGSAVYRLYNKNNGDHLLTKNKNEKNDLIDTGWEIETTNVNYGRAAFYVPVKADNANKKPVYRIYNPNSGEHFYTILKTEADAAVKTGWQHETNEDYTWVSDGDIKVYREFNPDVHTAGSHNFSTNLIEHQWLVAQGWQDEANETSLWTVLKAGF